MRHKIKRSRWLLVIPLIIAAVTIPILAHDSGNGAPPSPPQIEGLPAPPTPPPRDQLQPKPREPEQEVDVEESEFIDDPETLDAIWEKFETTIELPEGAVLRNRVVVKSLSRTVCAYNFHHFVNGYRIEGDIFRVRIRIDTEPPQRLPVLEYPVLGVEAATVEEMQSRAKPMIWRDVTTPEVPAWELEKPTPDAEAVLADIDAPYKRFESSANLQPCWFAFKDGRGVILDIETHEVIGTWCTPPVDSPSATAYEGPDECNPTQHGDYWPQMRNNADDWFDQYGFTSTEVFNDEDAELDDITKPETAYHYVIAHGGNPYSISYKAECPNKYVTASEITTGLTDRHPMELTILMVCQSLHYTGSGKLEHAFREGYGENTCVVGLRDTPSDDFAYADEWQNAFFNYLNNNHSITSAFQRANDDYAMMGQHMRKTGDGVPTVWRQQAYPFVSCGLADILDDTVIVWGFKQGEGSEGWTYYNPNLPPEENTLTTVYRGRGYWVNVADDCTLTYGQNYYRLDAGWNLIGWHGYYAT
jgi:hypothetical protein